MKGVKHTTKEIGRFEGFVSAHENVEVDVGLGEGGHVWVLCDRGSGYLE
jgi:hypothetical protein